MDCRLINPFCEKRTVRLEDLRHIPEVVDKGDWGCTEDLKSGYWQIKLH